MNNGADVDGLDSLGRTPLGRALGLGNETAVRVLLELGVKTIGGHGISEGYDYILELAVGSASVPIIKMLLDSIRGDRRATHETKCKAILKALWYAGQKSEIAELLQVELMLLYSKGKSQESIRGDQGALLLQTTSPPDFQDTE